MKILVTERQYSRIMEDVEPSKTAVKNICTAEKFCSSQGKITFGQLRALVDAGKRERLAKHIGEGGVKALIRIIPWFLPQVAIAGFIGSSARALNKLFKPALTETESYKTWWGQVVLKSFKLSEGEINLGDPFSRIFTHENEQIQWNIYRNQTNSGVRAVRQTVVYVVKIATAKS